MNKTGELQISFYNMISTISDSIDLMSNEVVGHHKLVAYIASRLGNELKLNTSDLRKTVFSALIHDIGILYFDKNIDMILRDRNDIKHAKVGSYLLADYPFFAEYAEIIKNHHTDWKNLANDRVNYLSNIVNLADIAAFFIDRMESNSMPSKLTDLVVDYSTDKINSEILGALKTVSEQESFWLDAVNINIREKILRDYISEELDVKLDLSLIFNIGEIVSRIVDFRSQFTSSHSKVISAVASNLAKELSFSDQDITVMKIAGYFHDIGKMVLPLSIINKSGELSQKEWSKMKSHTYYSYYVLENIKEIPRLRDWAAYHHETLDGKGYPFKLNKTRLDIGSRILAVADIFTALSEKRPYREEFGSKKVITILEKNVKQNKIDENIVGKLLDNLDKYYTIRKEKQKKSVTEFKKFKDKLSQV